MVTEKTKIEEAKEILSFLVAYGLIQLKVFHILLELIKNLLIERIYG